MTVQDTITLDTLRFERLLDAPREKVWQYLVDPELRKLWFMGGPTDLRAGGSFGLSMNHHLLSDADVPTPERYRPYIGHSWAERILRVDPPQLLAFTWEDGKAGEVTFELYEEDGKTRLVLTHAGIHGRKDVMNFGGGWHSHLATLTRRLREEPVLDFWALHEQAEATMQAALDQIR